MLLSGSAKPVTIVGMPLSRRARGRSAACRRSGRAAGGGRSARSNASSPSCTAGASGGTRPGVGRRRGARARARRRRARPRAAAARPRPRSSRRPGPARAGSRGSPRPRPAAPSSGGSASRPRSRSRRARARRTCAGRTPRPPSASTGLAPGLGEHLRARDELAQAARSSSVGGAIPSRSGSGQAAVARLDRRESVCSSACIAFSAAPPNRPECRSRAPVRSVRWK